MPLTTLADAETRLDGFSHAKKQDFLTLFTEYRGDMGKACDGVGVGLSTVYQHRQHDATFDRSLRMAKSRLAHALTPVLYEQATQKGNVLASIWLQKKLDPAEFDEHYRGVQITAKNLIIHYGSHTNQDNPLRTPIMTAEGIEVLDGA